MLTWRAMCSGPDPWVAAVTRAGGGPPRPGRAEARTSRSPPPPPPAPCSGTARTRRPPRCCTTRARAGNYNTARHVTGWHSTHDTGVKVRVEDVACIGLADIARQRHMIRFCCSQETRVQTALGDDGPKPAGDDNVRVVATCRLAQEAGVQSVMDDVGGSALCTQPSALPHRRLRKWTLGIASWRRWCRIVVTQLEVDSST
jgi:hypothetical protein